MLSYYAVHSSFIVSKFLPISLLEPKGVSRKAKAVKSVLNGLLFFLNLFLQYLVCIKPTRLRVPLAVVEYFYLAPANIVVHILYFFA